MIQDAISDLLNDLEKNHPDTFQEFMKRSGFVKVQRGGDSE